MAFPRTALYLSIKFENVENTSKLFSSQVRIDEQANQEFTTHTFSYGPINSETVYATVCKQQ